jgi:hypothetical protein
MTRVTITGWTEGLNKVELNHLLREFGGYRLKEAKDAVDRLIGGEEVTLEVADTKSAIAFQERAALIGAQCSIPAILDSQQE